MNSYRIKVFDSIIMPLASVLVKGKPTVTVGNVHCFLANDEDDEFVEVKTIDDDRQSLD